MIGRRLRLSQEFHPFHPCRTLRFERKRRLPPARERLAKHSGNGSGESIGTGPEGGDEKYLKSLIARCRGAILSPFLEVAGGHLGGYR